MLAGFDMKEYAFGDSRVFGIHVRDSFDDLMIKRFHYRIGLGLPSNVISHGRLEECVRYCEPEQNHSFDTEPTGFLHNEIPIQRLAVSLEQFRQTRNPFDSRPHMLGPVYA